MSDQFPSLAEVLVAHRWYPQTNGCFCGNPRYMPWADHADHQAEVWREACTVTTVEQLDALPDRAVILDVDGVVLRRNPWLSDNPALWFPLDGYSSLEQDFGIAAEDIDLPARVIHNPDWETK